MRSNEVGTLSGIRASGLDFLTSQRTMQHSFSVFLLISEALYSKKKYISGDFIPYHRAIYRQLGYPGFCTSGPRMLQHMLPEQHHRALVSLPPPRQLVWPN